ncbi:glycoside hydrolase family 16 protein [Dyadobacter diqingensis]|uniref:glycoside hydrolase family 16 protein n=1 Tax=Dyadobacter diqingensis TaxID=2938121 RepID=UPI0020C5A8CD|nr:glycoside hydrolase family 16 protein [Dyadobacter diqingensis]
MKISSTFIISGLFLLLSVSSQAQWKLVWSDEFNIDGKPSPKNWKAEKGFVRNHEFQWFQEDNAYCKNGMLTIEARKEEVKNPNYIAGSKNWKEERPTAHYTSASLITQGMQSFQYGRFEMKAKIDTRSGMWPAFWTLGNEGEWPENGEIDIMEFYRGTILANAVWGSMEKWKGIWSTVKKPVSEFNDPEWSNKFHVWRMDWDEKSIRLYVDDLLMNSIDLEKTYNAKEPRKNPFRQPHYILIGMAIGGDNGGDPSKTEFPARYEIDYVRVYQK